MALGDMAVRPPVGPVQLQPAGLIGLLQLKVGGFSPDALRQDVQPVVPIDGYWLRSAMQQKVEVYRQVGVAPLAINSVYALLTAGLQQLAPGEKTWWYVENVTVIIIPALGATVELAQLSVAIPGGPGGLGETVLGVSDPISIPVMSLPQILTAKDFWVPPGGRIGVYVTNLGGVGNVDFYMQGIRYAPCPA